MTANVYMMMPIGNILYGVINYPEQWNMDNLNYPSLKGGLYII